MCDWIEIIIRLIKEILPVVVHTEILDGWGMYYISAHFLKKTKTYKTDNIRILYYIIMCYYALRSCTRHEWIREKYNNINRRHLPQMKIIEHLHKGDATDMLYLIQK